WKDCELFFNSSLGACICMYSYILGSCFLSTVSPTHVLREFTIQACVVAKETSLAPC
uniref:Uncharacterized protein n=1 Tax=Aegilops tauschii subsp. strangulata TaxID=200361 RepID=A0A453SCK2_AEGTS